MPLTTSNRFLRRKKNKSRPRCSPVPGRMDMRNRVRLPRFRRPAAGAYIMLLVVEPAGEPMVCGPPVTEPPDAICCCTACVSCGVVVVAVQVAVPFAAEAASALTETPHTLAATSIGTCAVTGMLSRLTLSDTDRLLSTLCRSTLTSAGTLVPLPPLVPPDVLPLGVLAGVVPADSGADDWVVLQPANASASTA